MTAVGSIPSIVVEMLIDYLRSLQVLSKWHRPQSNVTVGDLVLVQALNLSPTLCKMGRVESIHPGENGVVRVVILCTSDGTLKRPVVKLALLPYFSVSSTSLFLYKK